MVIIINNNKSCIPRRRQTRRRQRDRNRSTRALEPRNVAAGVTSLGSGGVSYPAGAGRARAGALGWEVWQSETEWDKVWEDLGAEVYSPLSSLFLASRDPRRRQGVVIGGGGEGNVLSNGFFGDSSREIWRQMTAIQLVRMTPGAADRNK